MNKKEIKSKLNQLIHHVYYYVPPCPCCGSPITGHTIKIQGFNPSDIDWQVIESLKHGELIRPLDEVKEKNCFCLNCGYEWEDMIETRFLSNDEINEEKKKRSTSDILNVMMQEKREKLASQKHHSVLSIIKNFTIRF